MTARIDMTGQRFASLVAIADAGQSASGDRKWKFRCDCSAEFVATGLYARNGKITTCPKCAAERTRQASLIHGKSETPEFAIWTGILTRCYNKNAKAYPRYGGRGITMCASWKDSFEAFLADMGPRPSPNHSVDRRNNDGNYEPSNCRWATWIEQANNRRNNRLVTVDGRTQTVHDWARETGLPASTISQRVGRNKNRTNILRPSERALTQGASL